MAGTSRRADGLERAFRWYPATRAMTDLGTLGGFGSQGAGINDLGHVAGAADTAGGDTQAFRWDPLSGMTDLGNTWADPRPGRSRSTTSGSLSASRSPPPA